MRWIRYVLALVWLLPIVVPTAAAVAVAAPPLAAAPARSGLTPAQSTVLAPVTIAATPEAAATPTPEGAITDTNGTYIAGLIIWAVIIVLVAVTAFLVWRTRPRR